MGHESSLLRQGQARPEGLATGEILRRRRRWDRVVQKGTQPQPRRLQQAWCRTGVVGEGLEKVPKSRRGEREWRASYRFASDALAGGAPDDLWDSIAEPPGSAAFGIPHAHG